jgi:hypothetical protein
MLKSVLVAAALCTACASLPASAMSLDNLGIKNAGNVENVAWACGRFRCWWQPSHHPRFMDNSHFRGGDHFRGEQFREGSRGHGDFGHGVGHR